MKDDPKRLLDEFSHDESLRTALSVMSPPALALPDHVRSSVEKSLVASSGPTAGSGLASGWGISAGALKWTSLLLLGVGAAATGGYLWASSIQDETSHSEKSHGQNENAESFEGSPKRLVKNHPEAEVSQDESVTTEPSQKTLAAQSAPQMRAPTRNLASKKIDTLEQEIILLTSVRSLIESNPAKSLRLLDSYAARFKDGQLKQEATRLRKRAIRRANLPPNELSPQ